MAGLSGWTSAPRQETSCLHQGPQLCPGGNDEDSHMTELAEVVAVRSFKNVLDRSNTDSELMLAPDAVSHDPVRSLSWLWRSLRDGADNYGNRDKIGISWLVCTGVIPPGCPTGKLAGSSAMSCHALAVQASWESCTRI